jgi:glycosyltransferase involved in cell wall biosynthesis/O-antigen ligase
MTPIVLVLVVLVAPVALLVLTAVALDDRVAAAAITFTVGTNASAVLEVEHGVPGFLLPISLVAAVGAMLRRLARPAPDGGGEPRRVIESRTGFCVLVAIVVSATLGPFVASTPAASAAAVSLLLKHLVVVVGLTLVVRTPAGMRSALWGLVAAGASLACITVVQWVIGWRDPVWGFGSWSFEVIGGVGDASRAAGPFGDDPNAYAQYLVVMLGAAVGLLLGGADRSRARWLAAAAGLMMIAVLLTSSRSGMFGLAAVGGCAALVRRPSKRTLAVGGAAIVLLVVSLGAGSRLTSLSGVTDANDPAAEDVDPGLRGRTSEMLAAVDMFADHPVAGVGYGSYNDRYLDYSRSLGLDVRVEERSAHSLPLEIAAEQGVVGLAVWSSFVAFAVVAVRAVRAVEPAIGASLMLALVGFGTIALFLHDVHPRLMWSLIAMTIATPAMLMYPRRPTFANAGRSRPVVAMVIQNYVPALGGAERQLANLVPLLRERGIDPVVITRAFPGRPTIDEVDGARVIRIPVWGPKALRSAWFVVRGRWELARLRPDVVHAFDTLTPSTIALGHRARFGTPIVTKILRSGELGDLDRLERKWGGRERVRRLVSEVDVFVAISSDIVDELSERGVDERRRVLIPNGVDAQRFRPERARDTRPDGLPTGAIVIGTGRLAPEKHFVELAWHWKIVSARHPAAQLVLVGDGPERSRLESHTSALLLGQRDDIPELLRAADVYVSASEAEGLSNSLLEAMASGLPCVVTDVGGVRDVIRRPHEGIVVPAGEHLKLAFAIASLLDDPDRRRALGAAARRRVISSFSLVTTADRLADLYVNLAAVRSHLDRPVPSPTGTPAISQMALVGVAS